MSLRQKLELLVDEVTALVREERQRRALRFMTSPPGPTVNPERWQPIEPAPIHPGWQVTAGGSLAYQRSIDNACAPLPFVGSAVWLGMTGPSGSH